LAERLYTLRPPAPRPLQRGKGEIKHVEQVEENIEIKLEKLMEKLCYLFEAQHIFMCTYRGGI
jgi:hypothetical protein